jgi:hypothetical protein
MTADELRHQQDKKRQNVKLFVAISVAAILLLVIGIMSIHSDYRKKVAEAPGLSSQRFVITSEQSFGDDYPSGVTVIHDKETGHEIACFVTAAINSMSCLDTGGKFK